MGRLLDVATEIDPDSRRPEATRPRRRAACERQLGERLASDLVEAEVELLTHAHIVVCTDGGDGLATYTGPFPDALAALEAAAELQDSFGYECPDIRCVIAPLFPA